MCLFHRLFDGPETDIIPFGDLDKVLRTKFDITVELLDVNTEINLTPEC